MYGWMEGRNGWMARGKEWMDGWIDGWMDG